MNILGEAQCKKTPCICIFQIIHLHIYALSSSWTSLPGTSPNSLVFWSSAPLRLLLLLVSIFRWFLWRCVRKCCWTLDIGHSFLTSSYGWLHSVSSKRAQQLTSSVVHCCAPSPSWATSSTSSSCWATSSTSSSWATSSTLL